MTRRDPDLTDKRHSEQGARVWKREWMRSVAAGGMFEGGVCEYGSWRVSGSSLDDRRPRRKDGILLSRLLRDYYGTNVTGR